jgi:hypothetical protein
VSAHTPGPWVARKDPHGGIKDWCVGVQAENAPIDCVAVCFDHDARLIAAAPELLELLKAVSASLYINDYGDWSLKTDFNADGIDQVIAKATGSAS